MASIARLRTTEEYPILFVKNLSYTVTNEDLYGLFGKFGGIRQVRIGNDDKTKGTAFIVFNNLSDSKVAQDKLSGFQFQGRYLVVLFHSIDKMKNLEMENDLQKRKENLEALKEQYGIE